MNHRKQFTNHIVNLFKSGKYDIDDLEAALNVCWGLGSSLAFYHPGKAYEEMGISLRELFAKMIIETLMVREGKFLEVDRDEVDEAINWCMNAEKVFPVSVLTSEDGWIIGKRSNNLSLIHI